MNRYPLTDSNRHTHACGDCFDTGRADCLACGGLGCTSCDDEGSHACYCSAGEALSEALEYSASRVCEVCGDRAMACGTHPRCPGHDEEMVR